MIPMCMCMLRFAHMNTPRAHAWDSESQCYACICIVPIHVWMLLLVCAAVRASVIVLVRVCDILLLVCVRIESNAKLKRTLFLTARHISRFPSQGKTTTPTKTSGLYNPCPWVWGLPQTIDKEGLPPHSLERYQLQ